MRSIRLSLFLSLAVSAPCLAADPGDASISKETAARASDGVGGLKTRVGARNKAGSGLEGRYWVEIMASTREQRTAIAAAGVSIEEVRADRIVGTGHIRDIEALQARGFAVVQMTSLEALAQKGFPANDKAYHDYAQTLALIKDLAAKNPELVSFFSIGKTWQDRDVWALRLNTSASGAAPSSKPGVLLMGTHHAREHLTTEVPLLIAARLCENKAKPEVRKLLESRDIYVIPMVNPDGVEYDIATGSYRWQRKNMRVNPGGEIGVDLNRNYGYHWGEGGASDQPYSDTYRGPSGFSEPETQAIKKFVEGRPNLKTSISYHSYGSLVFWPWSYSYDQLPDQRDLKAYKAAAEKMASLTGYTAEQSSELYVSSGDTDDWMYGVRRIFGFTFELEGSSFYPGAAAIEPSVKKNYAAALYLIGIADNVYQASEGAAVASAGEPAGEGNPAKTAK